MAAHRVLIWNPMSWPIRVHRQLGQSLVIEVGGCDVLFKNGPAPTMKYRGSYLHLGDAGAQVLTYDAGGTLQSIYINSDGCLSSAQLRCARTCRVDVTLPADYRAHAPPGTVSTIKVAQISSDESPLLTVEAELGTTIDAKLVIRGQTIQSRLDTVTLGDFYFQSNGRQVAQNIMLYVD